MPKNISQALNLLDNSKILKEYLTKEYIDLYVDLKKKELKIFYDEISDLEYKWYLNL